MNKTALVAFIVVFATSYAFGPTLAHASEVTGQLSSGTADSGSQVSGTFGGGSTSGSSITGTVSGGSGGGGGSIGSSAGGGGGSIGGSSGGSNPTVTTTTVTNPGPGQVLGASTENLGSSSGGSGSSLADGSTVPPGEIAVATPESPTIQGTNLAAVGASGFLGISWWLWLLLLLILAAAAYGSWRYSERRTSY